MSKRDRSGVQSLADLDKEQTFDEPWQARIMALVSEMTGSDTPIERATWSQELGSALTKQQPPDEPEKAGLYFEIVLRLFEKELIETGLLTRSELDQRLAEWLEAYRKTPHGQPVVLDDTSGPQKSESEE